MPSTVAPSLKVTVPPGVPVGEVTLAVKSTLCPALDGLSELMHQEITIEKGRASPYRTAEEWARELLARNPELSRE